MKQRGTDADYIKVDRDDLHDYIMAKTLIITGIFLILFNLGVIYIHKNYGNTATQDKEIDDEINMAVTQYFALRGDDPSSSESTSG